MIRIERVNGKNVWEILRLRVREDQKSFVAGNDVSIIEAYTAVTGGGYAFPFGIYDDDVPVGFLMVGYDTDEYWENPPEIARKNYNLWRFMIDERYQHRGYGRGRSDCGAETVNSVVGNFGIRNSDIGNFDS